MNYKFLYVDNLLYNLSKFKNKKICAMVKANAYGHDIKNIVEILKSNVDYFGVVNVEEGKIVRKICDNPILICSKISDVKTCKQYSLDMMVENDEDIKKSIKIGYLNNLHLKLNCGMNRYGCNSQLNLKIINHLLMENEITLKSIYTHFSQCNNKFLTKKAYNKFLNLKKEISQNPLICFGGSGIYNYNFNYDMIRIGIGLYGYGNNLLPVMEIYSTVNKVFFAQKGDYIGYGKKYKVRQNGFYAVVGLGYGDGLRRNLSGQFSVKINNKLYNSVGNICMDAFFVQVDDSVCPGDKVCVMWNAEEMANKIHTISYEILTGFSNLRGKTILKYN